MNETDAGELAPQDIVGGAEQRASSDTAAVAELDSILREIDARGQLTKSSVSAKLPIEKLFAGLVGAQRKLYAATVSKEGNLRVRFRQSERARDAEVGIAIIPDDDFEKYIDPNTREAEALVSRFMPELNRREKTAIVICAKTPIGWRVVRVVGVADEPTTVVLARAFPTAKLHAIAESEVHQAAIQATAPFGAEPEIAIQIDSATERMVRLAIASAPAILLVGPPGTGKTTILKKFLADLADDPSRCGLTKAPSARWVTPDESWTSRELIGGETVDDQGRLRFRLGHALEAIRDDEWLILDEANRADMDKIFGGLLTWLSGYGNVNVGRASSEVHAGPILLDWGDEPECATHGVENLGAATVGSDPIRFAAGTEWRLLGTYNAVDAQRVFRFGQALGRRFVQVPVPPMSVEEFRKALLASGDQDEMLTTVVALYEAHLGSRETTLGPAPFFWMPKYVRKGRESDPQAEVGDLVAEAYLLAVGVWLARLDDSDLDKLKDRIGTAIDGNRWKWMKERLPSLG